MSRFFPRDVIHWGEEQLHPLRAFAVRTLEPAGATGLVLRLYRASVLSLTATGSMVAFIGVLIVGALYRFVA